MRIVKSWLMWPMGVALTLAIAAGCANASPSPTPTLTPAAMSTLTPLPIKEWNLERIQVDSSTVTVLLRVYAGIDVRVTLDGRGPDQVTPHSPLLEFAFQNVAVGKHTIEVRDVVGYGETAEVVVPGTAAIPNENPEDVTFEELFSDPDQYNGRDILLEGFYFHGWETIVLSERMEYTGMAEGHLWPRGRTVWIENDLIPTEVYDQLYQQEMIGPLERYGKLRIRGRFEHGERYGHLGGFAAQMVPSEVELLPWSPAPPQPDYSMTDLKFRLIEHFGGVLVGDPVIFPDDVRGEQAREAFPTIRENEEEFQAILDQLGLERGSEFTEAQQLLVFEEKKKLNAVSLEPTESGYSFWMMVREGGDPYEIRGVAEQTGKLTVLTKEYGRLPR